MGNSELNTLGVFAMIFDAWDRLLLVRMNYGRRQWTTPGGRVESGEAPLAVLHREVWEESACRIAPLHLIGTYAKPYANDLVLSYRAGLVEEYAWQANDEICGRQWLGRSEIPTDMSFIVATRIQDAFDGVRGVSREFTDASRLGRSLESSAARPAEEE